MVILFTNFLSLEQWILTKEDAHNIYKKKIQRISIDNVILNAYGLIGYKHMHLWLQECCQQIKIWIKTTT